MTVHTPGGSPWPARCAYAAAGLFSAASGVTNLLYGIAKGTDFGTSVVWGTVSAAVSIIFALSWPAILICADRKQWSRATMAVIALLLTGTYSVTAALGSAMSGRTSAAIEEQDAKDRKAKVQAKWDAAKAELDQLNAAKPAAELQSLIDNAKAELSKLPATRSIAELEALTKRGCPARVGLNVQAKALCPKYDIELGRAWDKSRLTSRIAELTTEIGQAEQRRAQQREKAQGVMSAAEGELAAHGSPRPANTDALALATFLQALGLSIDADRVNKLLVLLAVLVIECGGGLALAVGMAFGNGSPEHTKGTQGTHQETHGTISVPSGVTLPQQLPQGVSECTPAFLGDRRGRPNPVASGTQGTPDGGTANTRC